MPKWKKYELGLLLLFLFGRAYVGFQRIGEDWGFDIGPHLAMLTKLSWTDVMIPVRESFYSHHPPLAFLFARTLHLLGFSEMVSVQLIAMTASLIAFFCLRATFQHLNFLEKPVGIAALYLSASIPLQVYLSYSVNFDVLILMFASITLLLSVKLFWVEEDGHSHQKGLLLAGGIVLALAGALLTKFNGLILCALPPIVSFFRPQQWTTPKPAKGRLVHTCKQRMRMGLPALVLCLIALVLVSPYYYQRNYVGLEGDAYATTVTGRLFPNNVDSFIEPHQIERDKAPMVYLKNVLFAPLASAEGTKLADFDFEGVRLYEVWNSIWARNTWFRSMEENAILISTFYSLSMRILLITGFCIFWHRRKNFDRAWASLCCVFFSFAAVELLTQILFIYKTPYAPWTPAKAMFISPIVWALGALLAHHLLETQWVRTSLTHRWEYWQKAMLGVVALFVILNHVVPVY